MRAPMLFACILSLAAALPCAGADSVTGWRANWTGRFPDVEPMLKWSEQENVVWKEATPGWGNATPVIVGDRVFYSAEKMALVCASLADGKVRWKKEVAYGDIFGEEEKPKIEEARTKTKEIENEMAPFNKDLRKVGKELREVGKQLKKDKENEELKAKSKELKAKAAELKKKVNELRAKLKPFEKYKIPKTEGTNGYSSPTPVTDGTHVYALYCPGIVACYDMSGTRTWMVMTERPVDAWGHSASPVLVDGTLVVHVINVFGLDPATGKEKWKSPSRAHWGSPIPARIGDTGVVVTTNGEIIRASDGKILAKGLFALTYGTPVVHDGVVYALDGATGVAVKLPEAVEGDTAKTETVCKVKIKKDRYYASPLVHEGIVYAITQKGVLSALDVKDGKKLYEQQVKELGKGTTFPSLVLAGKNILVSMDNGTTLVVKPGSTFEILQTNKLDKFRTTPVFAGNRMVVRTLKNLYLIGAK